MNLLFTTHEFIFQYLDKNYLTKINPPAQLVFMKRTFLFLIAFVVSVCSASAGITKSKHDNTETSKFEKKSVTKGKGISRDSALEEEGDSKFERRTVSKWSDAKKARIQKERAAKKKAAKKKKNCRGGG